MKQKLKKALSKVNWEKIFSKENIFFFAIFILYLTNALHERYPDEYDNLLGGKLILQGVFPYISYMAHHGPVAYFLAAVLQIFSGFHIARFRIVYALFLTLILKFVHDSSVKKFGNAIYVKIFAVLSGISLMYFWFQMLLADSLAAFFLILPYGYLIYADITNKKINRKDISLVNIFLFLTLFTSISYSFFIITAYLFLAYLYLKDNKIKSFKEFFSLAWQLATPYLIFFVYLLITRSLSDYFFQNFTYNTQYYISDYPKGPDGQNINFIRYAIVLSKQTMDTVLLAIPHVLKFNLYESKTVALLGMNLFFFIYLLFKKKPLSAVFVVAMILLGNTRVPNIEVSELGYQQAVYIILSLLNGSMLLSAMLTEKKENDYRSGVLMSIMIANLFYVIVYASYIAVSYTNRVYGKFMGELSLVYDRPEMAPTLNRLLDKNEYGWIGPFYHDELYYADFKVPSKYYWILPASAKSDKIVTEMMADFENNKPKAIIFNTGFSAFGADAISFTGEIRDFLDRDYTRIRDVKDQEENPIYNCVVPTIRNFDCNSFLFIRNDQLEPMLEKMLGLNMLETLN